MAKPQGVIDLHPIASLILSAILGGAIGLQRQAAQKPAGFRTHLLVSVGCCAFVEISRLSGDTRIAANVLTGIGFIGAGAIFRAGVTAHGLTTAASIWAAAAIGMAIGFGYPSSITLAGATTVITVIALALSDSAFDRIFRRKAKVSVLYAGEPAAVAIVQLLSSRDVQYRASDEYMVSNADGRRLTQMHFQVALPHTIALSEVVREMAALPGVQTVSANEHLPSN
ncbi:MAG: hypothetical protein DLM50_03615 [Candidatus Meridianibacter frigidus]|nr:MAG: hypothetical protein DLM50_03615 [Candidatus Eremiobacteraeota bacterium]